MCLKLCFTRSNTVRKHLLISFIQFFLSSALCPVFTVSDFLFCRREQIYLVQTFPMAQIHYILF